MNYAVFLYTNHTAKTFSLAKRNLDAPGNPLKQMKESMNERGFEDQMLISGVMEPVASQFRDRLHGDMLLAGYAYETRKAV